MKVKDVMTKTVYRVKNTQTLNDAAKLMWDHDCGWLPVVDDNDKVVAALTDRDIAMAAFLNGRTLSELPAAKAQSHELFTCSPSDGIDKVEDLMKSHRVRRLPVIDKAGGLVGVLSLNDIALAFEAKHEESDAIALSDTLAGICSHVHAPEQRAAVA